jgi:hypothetical protein
VPHPNQIQVLDAYGHERRNTQPAALTAGAVGTTAIGTIAPTVAAGAAPTVTFAAGQEALDMFGTFTLNPVTGGGAQAAGEVVGVYFRNPLPRVPRAILCTIIDDAMGAAIACGATTILATSFQISVGVALTTAHTYTIVYRVFY